MKNKSRSGQTWGQIEFFEILREKRKTAVLRAARDCGIAFCTGRINVREVPKLARYQLRYTRMTELYYSKGKKKSPLKIVEKRQWTAEMVGERGIAVGERKAGGEKLWTQKQRKASEI